MIRIIAFVVAVIVVAAAATWISEPPGRVEIAWGDYMVETSPGTLAAALAVAAAIVLVIAAVVRFVWIGPRRVALARRRRRERCRQTNGPCKSPGPGQTRDQEISRRPARCP